MLYIKDLEASQWAISSIHNNGVLMKQNYTYKILPENLCYWASSVIMVSQTTVSIIFQNISTAWECKLYDREQCHILVSCFLFFFCLVILIYEDQAFSWRVQVYFTKWSVFSKTRFLLNPQNLLLLIDECYLLLLRSFQTWNLGTMNSLNKWMILTLRILQ